MIASKRKTGRSFPNAPRLAGCFPVSPLWKSPTGLPARWDFNAEAQSAFHDLTEILHSIKSFSAHQINKATGHKGSVEKP
jgi:hypothetical protein